MLTFLAIFAIGTVAIYGLLTLVTYWTVHPLGDAAPSDFEVHP